MPVVSQTIDPAMATPFLKPVASYVRFLGQEIVIAGLTMRSLILLRESPRLFASMKGNLVEEGSKGSVELSNILTSAVADAHLADEEFRDDFRTLVSHHSVAVWAGIETTVEQTLVTLLRKTPDAYLRALATSPNLKSETFKVTTAKEARNTLRSWERSLKSPDVIERTLTMFSAFGISIPLSLARKRRLSELAEFRNVILHRGGLADESLLKKCPWLKLKEGQAIDLRFETLSDYFESAQELALGLMKALIESPFPYMHLTRSTPISHDEA